MIPVQIADVVKARGEDGRSLLTAAAEGGNEAVFVEVIILMGGKVSGTGYMRVKRCNPSHSEDITVSDVRNHPRV